MSDNPTISPEEELKIPLPDDATGDSGAQQTAAESEWAGLHGPAMEDLKTRDIQQDSEKDDLFLVTLAGREHLSPHSWGVNYRIFLTLFTGLLLLNATFASSAPTGLIPDIIEHFHVSEEIGVLLISIYCLGPLLWGPLSERYGRKNIFIVAFIPYVAFQVGCALSKNIASLIVFRFLGGAFASSPLTNSGGCMADLWGPEHRGSAMASFALMPFAGPSLAPLISGFMHVTGTEWRWIFWLLTIFSGGCLLLIPILLPETYVPYILYREAKRLRQETGDSRWHASLEEGGESFRDILNRTIFKPFIMIVQEPMLAVVTLYMSFIYGVFYLLFEALPIIFGVQHGLNAGLSGLPFLSLVTGAALGVLIYIFYFNKNYVALHRQMAPRPVPPEVRLYPILFAAPALAVAFFWIAWTSYASINIASPIIALAVVGCCVMFVFNGCINYIVDTYLRSAASALAINTVCRSTFGAGFPLFAGQMYRKLGTPGASSLLGGLAIVFIPAPFLLVKYGKKIRGWSKNAVVREDE